MIQLNDNMFQYILKFSQSKYNPMHLMKSRTIEEIDDFITFERTESNHSIESKNSERTKKVKFFLPPLVHEMHTWLFAYKNARRGKWEQIARDRSRFEYRIKRMEKIISPILFRRNSNLR